MKSLRISRVFPEYSLDLVNAKLYRHEAGKTTVTHLETMTALEAALHHQLGMPRCPIASAVGIVKRLTGKPFFNAGSAAG